LFEDFSEQICEALLTKLPTLINRFQAKFVCLACCITILAMKFSVQIKYALHDLFTKLANLLPKKEILTKICLLLQVLLYLLHTD